MREPQIDIRGHLSVIIFLLVVVTITMIVFLLRMGEPMSVAPYFCLQDSQQYTHCFPGTLS